MLHIYKMKKFPFKSILIIVILFIFLRVFFPVYRVVSDSMEPTYQKGTFIIVSRFFYSFFPIERNDIILMKPLKGVFEKGVWVHRVIGVEGDTVKVAHGTVQVNKHASLFPEILEIQAEEVTVPKGYVFQKGDNPNTIYGLISKDAIMGKVVFSF
jgi:signal peptidase I